MSGKQDQDEEPGTYVESLDKPVTLIILEWLGFASNAISMQRYDLAIEDLDTAYNFCPTQVKLRVGVRPSTAIDAAIAKIPSEEELLTNDDFRQKNPSPRAPAVYRWRTAQQVIRAMVKDFHDRMIGAIEASGLYVQSAGGGLDTFGNYQTVTSGMGFLGPNQLVQRPAQQPLPQNQQPTKPAVPKVAVKKEAKKVVPGASASKQ